MSDDDDQVYRVLFMTPERFKRILKRKVPAWMDDLLAAVAWTINGMDAVDGPDADEAMGCITCGEGFWREYLPTVIVAMVPEGGAPWQAKSMGVCVECEAEFGDFATLKAAVMRQLNDLLGGSELRVGVDVGHA